MFSVADGMVNGHGDVGVPDMVTISDIDEHVINNNLKKRYSANKIYVSDDNDKFEYINFRFPRNMSCMCKVYPKEF